MGHIFISYSHKDSSYVHKLADALEQEGFEVWIDDHIHYGSEWPKVVTRNLDASDGVIVVLSNNSYESDMVQNEVTRAREKKKPIFPLLLEGENWLIVQAKQFVDVRDSSIPTEKFFYRLEEITPRRNERAERKKNRLDVERNESDRPARNKKKAWLQSEPLEANATKFTNVFEQPSSQKLVSNTTRKGNDYLIFSVGILLLCAFSGLLWYLDLNFLWCTFFPFLGGC